MRFNIVYVKSDALAGSTQRDFASYDEAQAWLFARVEESHHLGQFERPVISGVIALTNGAINDGDGPGYKTYQFHPVTGRLLQTSTSDIAA